MKVSELMTGNSLKVEDLDGAEVDVIITKVEAREFANDDGTKRMRPVVHFSQNGVELDKTLVCNVTNTTKIAEVYGDETDDWIGKPVTLYPDTTMFRGSKVGCIRVRVQRKKGSLKGANGRKQQDADKGDGDIPF